MIRSEFPSRAKGWFQGCSVRNGLSFARADSGYVSAGFHSFHTRRLRRRVTSPDVIGGPCFQYESSAYVGWRLGWKGPLWCHGVGLQLERFASGSKSVQQPTRYLVFRCLIFIDETPGSVLGEVQQAVLSFGLQVRCSGRAVNPLIRNSALRGRSCCGHSRSGRQGIR